MIICAHVPSGLTELGQTCWKRNVDFHRVALGCDRWKRHSEPTGRLCMSPGHNLVSQDVLLPRGTLTPCARLTEP